MAKTLYEGYRVGKNGGERWTGTIQDRAPKSRAGSALTQAPAKTSSKPKGGSVIGRSATTGKFKG